MARGAHGRVMEVLPWEGEISIIIGDWPDRHPKGEAVSKHDGIYILPDAIRNGPLGRPEYLLYEEIGHHVITAMGLPTEGLAAVFFQELFAGCLKFTLARRHLPELFRHLAIPPVPGPHDHHVLFYSLGTDVGGLLAGVEEVRPALEQWTAEPGLDEADMALRAWVQAIYAELVDEKSMPRLARRCIELYENTVDGAAQAQGESA